MGWANCGEDSKGRQIGYAHEATCDHPECDARIDRGLSYACGDQHGEDVYCCELYFCGKHLEWCEVAQKFVCAACVKINAEAAK